MEVTFRPNINSFTGEYAEAVKRFQKSNQVEEDHIQQESHEAYGTADKVL